MRLLLTRALNKCASLKAGLEEAGFEVALFPLIEILPPKDGGAQLKKAAQNILQYHWLVLTSANAVSALANQLTVLPKNLRVVVVGPKTATPAQELGWKVLQPASRHSVTNGGAAGIVSFFQKKNMAGQKVLYPRSSIGREELAVALKKMGAAVDVVEAYQTKALKTDGKKLKALLKKGVDAVLFFSPSAVAAFKNLCEENGIDTKKLSSVPFGKTTAAALRNANLRVAFIPRQSEEKILVKELKEFFAIPE